MNSSFEKLTFSLFLYGNLRFFSRDYIKFCEKHYAVSVLLKLFTSFASHFNFLINVNNNLPVRAIT